MSAILGIVTAGEAAPPDAVVRRMMHAMRSRGAALAGVWRDGPAVLAVARHEWEATAGLSGDVTVVRDGDLVVAADASLYYRAELERDLRASGVSASGATPSHLILAAFRAWGEDCAAHLDGDFAFIVWDRAARIVCCSRDFTGKRSLHYAELGGTLVIASTIAAVLEHPACPRELDLECLGANAAGLFAAPDETCYRAVRTLPAGATMVRRALARPRVRRHWRPPEIDRGRVTPFDAAADELRELLGRAVSERCAPDGPTAVWLSGGYDSSAIFGAGAHALRRAGDGRHLRAVSVSFPPDDPGREDELIAEIAAHWNTPVHWLSLDDIPLLERAAERAAEYDEPLVHAFEGWLRALMRGTRSVGARVAMYGDGGDQLFAVSDVYLADLFRQGRWMTLAREWRVLGRSGYRQFYHEAVEPALPGWVIQAIAAVRQRSAPPPVFERPVPPWIDDGFARRAGLVERERMHALPRRGATLATYETLQSLTYPLVGRVASKFGSWALDEGIEIRSPFYDRRVMEFVLPRPRWERASGGGVKHLLRHAMRGVLPDRVLAPRPFRTGMLLRYFAHSTRERYARLFAEAFERPVLAELGVVDARALRRAWERYRTEGGSSTGLSLFRTLQVELWLRARLRAPHAAPARREAITCTLAS